MTWIERLDEWTGHRFYTLCLIASYHDCKRAGMFPRWRLEREMVCLGNPLGFTFHLPPQSLAINTTNVTLTNTIP
jgi:hypothetical protein